MLVVILLLVVGYGVIHQYRKRTGRTGIGMVLQNHLILAGVTFVVAIVATVISIIAELHYDPQDMEFNAYQLTFTRGLSKGDTLVFTTMEGLGDTLIVTGIEEERKREPGIFLASPARHSKYVHFQRLADKSGYYDIGIMAFPQSKVRQVTVNFGSYRYADEGGGQSDTVTIGDTVLKGCYFRGCTGTFGLERSGSITSVIWTKEQGLIAYETAANFGTWYWRKL